MPARLFTVATFVLAPLVALACFEPPELDDALLPPLADLGGIDTWASIEEAGPPPGEDPPDEGPEPESKDPGADDPVDPALAQLKISEVLVDPEGKDGGADSPEFVEISNPGPLPVKLDGLRIDAASWPLVGAEDLGLTGLELGVDQLLVVRRWTTDVDAGLAGVDLADAVIWTGFLHSGGLRNADGAVSIEVGTMLIDQLIYGSTPADAPLGWTGAPVDAPGSATSMCRLEGPDHDDAGDWSSCPPNPGATESVDSPAPMTPPIPPGALSIVEVAANPPEDASIEKAYEYVEIVNISENELELGGCRIGDDPDILAPGLDPLEYVSGDGGCESPTCLAPGFRALIVGAGYLGESHGALVLSTDDSTIADGGLTNTEPVVLWDASDAMISSYRLWADPAQDPIPSDAQPIHRLDPAAPDEPQSWVSAPASPGI